MITLYLCMCSSPILETLLVVAMSSMKCCKLLRGDHNTTTTNSNNTHNITVQQNVSAPVVNITLLGFRALSTTAWQDLLVRHQLVSNHIARKRHSHLTCSNICIAWRSAHCGIAGVSEIDTHNFSQFVDEDAGTPSFVEYHEKQLQACGVRMGRSGYQVLHLHKTPMYHVEIGSKRYTGGVDGGVVPVLYKQRQLQMY